MPDSAQLWQLLRSLDDPAHLEHPAGYDQDRERARFEELAARLDAAFDCRCEVDRQVQDASLHGRIDVPAEATATGRRLVVCVSNFGGLAVVAVDNPGCWTTAELAELLDPTDDQVVTAALEGLGYVVVPEEPLWNVYDGALGRRAFGRGGTWWIRFFDYL